MLEYMILGNSVYQIIQFLTILIAGIIISKILEYSSKNIFAKLAKKTKNKLDDIIFAIMERPFPFMLIIIIIFFQIGVKYLTTTAAFDNIFKHVVFLAYVFCIAWFITKFFLGVIDVYLTQIAKKTKNKYDDQLVPILKNLTYVVVIGTTVTLVASNFGYDIGTLLAGLGIGGLAIALAAQDALGNLIGGVVLFSEKNFNIDDFVKINGEYGTIKEIGLRSTKIKKIDGTLLVIPNRKIADNNIENISYRKTRRQDITLGLTYNTSTEKINKAKDILKTILKKNKQILPNIYIRFEEFGAYSLDIKATYYITELNWGKYIQIKDKINTQIKKEFDKAKIEFAFPTQTIELKR